MLLSHFVLVPVTAITAVQTIFLHSDIAERGVLHEGEKVVVKG